MTDGFRTQSNAKNVVIPIKGEASINFPQKEKKEKEIASRQSFFFQSSKLFKFINGIKFFTEFLKIAVHENISFIQFVRSKRRCDR